MGSVTNSLSSSLNTILNPINTAGSSTTNGQFTGASAYSQDFQNTISRAVAIADLPITLLQNQQTDLTNQNNELSTLDGLFSSLNGAVSGIDSALNGGSSYQASYSVSNVVNATFAQGAAQGSYSINVSNLGAYQSTLSGQTWNASPSSNQYTLVVGANEYTFTPADDSAQTVASTINSLYGNLVSASAVNVGSQGTPDYRVSLQSNTLGPMNLDLVQLPSSPTYTSLQGASAPANYSTSQSSATWNPSGAPFTLVVGGNPYSITTSNNTAQGVAAAINAQYGNLVQATVVTGSGGASDYRINLQSATPSAATLDIQSSGVSLQTQGAPVSYSTSQTSSIWSDTANPSGTRSLYQLVVGSNTYSLAPPDNTAADVAATINSQFGSTVQATVTGTPGQAGYGISLRSTTAGINTTLNIQKTTATSYQSQQTAGALAQYSVDGAATVSSNSRAVTVSNGVTLNLVGTGSTTVSVTSSPSAISSALSSFASAYNAVVDELGKQRGQTGGPLQGQSIVDILSQTLNNIGTYTANGSSITNLASLGLTFDPSNNGHLDYSASAFLSADTANANGVTQFLGSASGNGFLFAATNALNGLVDLTTGIVPSTESQLQTQLNNLGTEISGKQAQVNQLQTELTSQMASADAMIASIEQQYSELSAMFQAQQTANQQYANG